MSGRQFAEVRRLQRLQNPREHLRPRAHRPKLHEYSGGEILRANSTTRMLCNAVGRLQRLHPGSQGRHRGPRPSHAGAWSRACACGAPRGRTCRRSVFSASARRRDAARIAAPSGRRVLASRRRAGRAPLDPDKCAAPWPSPRGINPLRMDHRQGPLRRISVAEGSAVWLASRNFARTWVLNAWAKRSLCCFLVFNLCEVTKPAGRKPIRWIGLRPPQAIYLPREKEQRVSWKSEP